MLDAYDFDAETHDSGADDTFFDFDAVKPKAKPTKNTDDVYDFDAKSRDRVEWSRPKPLGAPDDYMENVTPKGSTFLDEMRSAHSKEGSAVGREAGFFENLINKAKAFGTRESEIYQKPIGEQLGIRGNQAKAAMTGYLTAPARALLGLGRTGAELPTLAMDKDNAQAYLEGMPEWSKIGKDVVTKLTQKIVGNDPDAQLPLAAGSLVGDVGTMALGPKVAPWVGSALFAAPAISTAAERGAETGASTLSKVGSAAEIAFLAKIMGNLPVTRITEGIANTARPTVAKALALPLAGIEGGGLQAMQNAIIKQNIDPNYEISEGVAPAAALGVGMRLGMGHIGTGGVELKPKQDIYKILEKASGPEYAPGELRIGSTLEPSTISDLAQNPYMAGEFTPNVPQQGTRVTLETKPYPTARGSVEAPGPRLEQGFLDARAEAIQPMLENTVAKLRELESIKNPSRKVLRQIEVLRQSVEALSSPDYATDRVRDFGAEPIPENPRPSRLTMDTTGNETVIRPYEQGSRLIQQAGAGQPEAPVQLVNPYTAEGTMFGDNPSWSFDPNRAASSTDRAVMRGRSANLADAMGFSQAVTEGPWSQIPMEARNLAGEWFERMGQVHQDPNNAEFRAALNDVTTRANENPDVLKAIAILQNAKAEHAGAAAEALPFKDLAPDQLESWQQQNPYYLPRKVVFNEARGEVPEFIKAGVLTPDAFKARKIKWMINEGTGEKVLVNLDNPLEPPPAGYKYVDATRGEIQKGGNVTYLEDPMAALGRSASQLRSVKRIGEIKQFVDQQSALGDSKPAKIFEDAFGGGKVHDQSAMDNFNRTVTNVGFLNPFVHTPNQISHFVKALGIREIFGKNDNTGELIKAMNEMSNYSPEFREFLKNGGNAMRRGSYWNDIKGKMNEILQTPEVQNDLAHEFGGDQNRLNKFIQDTTSMPTWLLDDAMRFTLAKKAMVKNGGNWQKAIADVDRTFPDYRLNTYFTEGSSKVDKAMDAAYQTVFKSNESSNPVVRAVAPLFMKYRFGQWKSFMNMWGDSIKAVTHGDPAAIAQAGDKIAAVMFTKMVLLPAASGIYNAMFGDEKQGLKIKAREGGHQHAMAQLGELASAGKASMEQGDVEPFLRKANQFGQQFAIMNPAVRTAFALSGIDPYNLKGIEGEGRVQAALGGMPFGREVRAMTDYGQRPSQALAGALLGKVDRSDLEKYISMVKGANSFPINRDKMQMFNKLKLAIADGDQEAIAKYTEALGGEDSPDVKKAMKFAESTPEQRTFERLKSLQPSQLIGAYGAAGSEDEKNLVHAAIALKVENGKLNPFSMNELKNWQTKRGKQPPDAWLQERPWLLGED